MNLHREYDASARSHAPVTAWAAALILALLPAAMARAHDTWVEVNTAVVRVGDHVHVDLKLGNHGNGHRDFRITGKVDPAFATLAAVAPDGTHTDLVDALRDQGHQPGEGYWSARFVPQQTGVYRILHTYDRVVSYAPLRSIKSGKTFLYAGPSLDAVPQDAPGFDEPAGHPFELVPLTSPIAPAGPGEPVAVRLLFHGKPLAGVTISFIPRGVTLAPGFDERYQRRTNEDGVAAFTPAEGNRFLIVAHHKDAEARGEGYEGTKYTATLVLDVPQLAR